MSISDITNKVTGISIDQRVAGMETTQHVNDIVRCFKRDLDIQIHTQVTTFMWIDLIDSLIDPVGLGRYSTVSAVANYIIKMI